MFHCRAGGCFDQLVKFRIHRAQDLVREIQRHKMSGNFIARRVALVGDVVVRKALGTIELGEAVGHLGRGVDHLAGDVQAFGSPRFEAGRLAVFFFIEKYYNTIYKILYNASVKISKYRSYLQFLCSLKLFFQANY